MGYNVVTRATLLFLITLPGVSAVTTTAAAVTTEVSPLHGMYVCKYGITFTISLHLQKQLLYQQLHNCFQMVSKSTYLQ